MVGLDLPQLLFALGGMEPVLMIEYLKDVQIHQWHQHHQDQHDRHILGTFGNYRWEGGHHKDQHIKHNRHKGEYSPAFFYTCLNFVVRLSQFLDSIILNRRKGKDTNYKHYDVGVRCKILIQYHGQNNDFR